MVAPTEHRGVSAWTTRRRPERGRSGSSGIVLRVVFALALVVLLVLIGIKQAPEVLAAIAPATPAATIAARRRRRRAGPRATPSHLRDAAPHRLRAERVHAARVGRRRLARAAEAEAGGGGAHRVEAGDAPTPVVTSLQRGGRELPAPADRCAGRDLRADARRSPCSWSTSGRHEGLVRHPDERRGGRAVQRGAARAGDVSLELPVHDVVAAVHGDGERGRAARPRGPSPCGTRGPSDERAGDRGLRVPAAARRGRVRRRVPLRAGAAAPDGRDQGAARRRGRAPRTSARSSTRRT